MTYLRTKGKGFTVYFFFLISLAIFLCSVFLGCDLFLKWYGIIAGVILTLLAVPCHFFLGRKTSFGHFLSFLLNSVGAGFSVSAYYTVKNVSLIPEKLFFGILPSVILMLFISVFMVAMRDNKHILIIIFAVIEVALLVVSIVFWVNREAQTYAIMLFSLLLSSFYIAVLAVSVDEDERTPMRDCSFGSYGFYLVATVVVAVILLGAMGCDDCSCDGCDCGDCCDCDTGKGKKSKKLK